MQENNAYKDLTPEQIEIMERDSFKGTYIWFDNKHSYVELDGSFTAEELIEISSLIPKKIAIAEA